MREVNSSKGSPHGHLRRAFVLLPLFALALCLQACRGGSGAPEPRGEAGQGPAKAPPQVKVYVDEAQLQKPYAVVGGTVENSGGESLEGLSVEIELRRRGGEGKETRDVPVIPQVLGPGERGAYTLKVKSEEWGGFRVVRLKLQGGSGEVAFQPLPGRQRPPERVDATRTITEEGPSRRPSAGDDFINTPDTPIAVP